MINEVVAEGAAEFQLCKRLEGLLQLIDALKAIPDAARFQPAPPHATTGEPLAGCLLDYRRSRVTDELQSFLAMLDRWEDALQRPDRPESVVRLADLRAAVARMLRMLHPAQGELHWRDGEIPQQRHLSDPQPARLPVRARKQPRAPRLAALEEDLRRLVFRRSIEGTTSEEIEQDPEHVRLVQSLQTAQAALEKRERHNRLPIIHSSGYELRVKEWRLLNRARKMLPGRVEAWENAEGVVRGFGKGARVQAPDSRPAAWFKSATNEILYPDLLRVAVREGRLKESEKRGSRWHHSIEEVSNLYPEHRAILRTKGSEGNVSEAKG